MADKKNGTYSRRDLFRGAFLELSTAGGHDVLAEKARKAALDSLAEARAALARSDDASAELHLRSFLKTNTTRSDIRRLYALCLYRLGKHIQSRVEFIRLTRSGISDERTLAFLALTQLHTGQRERAIATLRSGRSEDPLWTAFFSSALERVELGLDSERLCASLESLLPPDPLES